MPVQKYVRSYLTKFNPIWFNYAQRTPLRDGRYLKSEENLLKIRENSRLSRGIGANSVRAEAYLV